MVLYTLHEVAAYLQVHPRTVRNMVKRHALPFFRVGRVYRFNKDEIDRWQQGMDTRKLYGRSL